MKTIGILGGMGPEATLDLAKLIMDLTPARKDQEHIPAVIHNNTRIPDRTLALLGEGESPVPELFRSVDILSPNVDFIVMPCNTAHNYYAAVSDRATVPVLHIVHETAKFIQSCYPDVSQVGLLATTGTVASRIYHTIFAQYGLTVIAPSVNEQESLVMDAIYGDMGIKAGQYDIAQKKLELAAEHLSEMGAELIIGGCTEIPLVLKQESVSFVLINPTKILAQKAVDLALDATVVVAESVLPESKMKKVIA